MLNENELLFKKIHMKKYKSREEFVADFELIYNNCLTYNGLNNSYTNTAQKLLSSCTAACDFDYREQLQQLEEAILMNIQEDNNEDENSQSGYQPHRVMPRFSAETHTDSESNLTPNRNESDNYESYASTSAAASLPAPMQSLTKKLKTLNKKIITNNAQPRPASGNERLSANMPGLSKKSKQFFFPSMASNKNSPRSGSDADVFVDVESIDDHRGFSHVNMSNKVNTKNNRANVMQQERRLVEQNEDENAYNQNYDYENEDNEEYDNGNMDMGNEYDNEDY